MSAPPIAAPDGEDRASRAEPRLRRSTALVLLGAIAAPWLILGLLEAWQDAPTWDEGIYIAAGVTALTRHQLRINIEHPPLAKVLAAAPALLAHPVVPDDPSFAAGREFDYSGQFVEAQRRTGRLRVVVFLARLVPLGEGVAVGAVLYGLGAALFGRTGGLVSAAFWFLNPFFLGLGHVGTIDVPATLTTLAAVALLLRLLRSPSWPRVAALGGAVGMALLVRSTALILAPIFAAGAGLALWRGSPRARRAGAAVAATFAVLGLAWVSVWLGVRAIAPHPWGPPAASDTQVVIARAAASEPWTSQLATAVPWPQEYRDGIHYLAAVSTPPGPGFVLGRAWDGGRWWYWPAAMVVKLPATTLLAYAAGLGICAAAMVSRRRWAPATAPRLETGEILVTVAVPALVLTSFVVTQPRDQGLRYLTPVLALMAIAAAPLARITRMAAGRVVMVALAAIQLVALVASYPHSLSWTTPPFRPAYQVEADANLDWNQDFYRFADWAQGKQPWVAYFGLPSIPLSAVPGARQLLHVDPRQVTGWAAAFGSILTTYDRDALAWLRAYCPVGTIGGGAILLYHFDSPPDPRPGPASPPAPCPGPSSHRVTP